MRCGVIKLRVQRVCVTLSALPSGLWYVTPDVQSIHDKLTQTLSPRLNGPPTMSRQAHPNMSRHVMGSVLGCTWLCTKINLTTWEYEVVAWLPHNTSREAHAVTAAAMRAADSVHESMSPSSHCLAHTSCALTRRKVWAMVHSALCTSPSCHPAS